MQVFFKFFSQKRFQNRIRRLNFLNHSKIEVVRSKYIGGENSFKAKPKDRQNLAINNCQKACSWNQDKNFFHIGFKSYLEEIFQRKKNDQEKAAKICELERTKLFYYKNSQNSPCVSLRLGKTQCLFMLLAQEVKHCGHRKKTANR